jgi:O-acetyl-ADP-ribose deacetylase (regulator of RNase III)
MIKYATGNLLNCPVEAIVNTVNCVGVMGAGLAYQFKKKYPKNYAHYLNECKKDNVIPGQVLVHTLEPYESDIAAHKFVLNFPTKLHWKQDSMLEYVIAGLNDLVKVIKDNSIKSIAIPPLGCGLGGLNWYDVHSLIVEKLKDVDCEIYIFVPQNTNGFPKECSTTTPHQFIVSHKRAGTYS